MNRKFKVISNFVMLSLTGLLLVMLSFGWYVVNKTSYVNGGTGLTSENDSVTFDTTVIAEIHYLNHVVTTETYTRDDDGSLYLIKRSTHDLELDTTTETNYELSSHEPFFIRSLLPGEYIDITIGYSISDDFDNSNYTIGFMNVNGSGPEGRTSFTLDGKVHYATGAYKWKNISLRSGSRTGTIINDFSTATYSWFGTYNINQNDATNIRIESLSHTWDSDYGSLYYTFRVFEDFTQYYELVGQSSTYTGDALLSFLTMKIGNVYVLV